MENGGNVIMIQVIKKIDSSLLENQPIIEYLRQFKNYKIVNEDIEEDNGEINIFSENELIKIIYIYRLVVVNGVVYIDIIQMVRNMNR